jgi:hypothetical protein
MSLLYHTPESIETQRDHTGGNQGDGGVLQWLGHPGQQDAFAQAGKNDQRQAESGCIAKRGDQCRQKTELLVDVQYANTEDGTVGRNQRQKNTQTGIQPGMLFLRNISTNCTREAITRMKAMVRR